MAVSAEQLTVIRTSLDPAGYVAGARQVEQANQRIVQSGEQVSQGQTRTERAIQATERAIDRMRKSGDPLYKTQTDLTRAQDLYNRAVERGSAQASTLVPIIERLRGRMESLAVVNANVATSMGVTRQQVQQLIPQFNDLGVQILSGQGLFLPLIQQGPQITQAMGGVGNTFRAMVGLITPARAAVVGFGGAIIATVAAFEAQQGRIESNRRALMGYQADYMRLGEEIERRSRAQSLNLPFATRADTAQVQQRLATFLPPEERDNLERYTELVVDLSRVYGDLGPAIDRVARGWRDASGAAREMMEQNTRGFTSDLVRQIELLELRGNRTEAFRLYANALRDAFGGAQARASDAERAVASLFKVWEGFTSGLADGLARVGGPVISWLANLGTEAERAGQRMARGLTMGTGAIGALGSIVGGRQLGSGTLPQNMSPGAAVGGTPDGADFRTRLGSAEGRNNYANASNPFGYLGRYQFGAAALYDLGLYQPSADELRRARPGYLPNTWEGNFVNPDGSSAGQGRNAFLNNPALQDTAFDRFLERIDRVIDRLGPLENRTVQGTPVTRDALRAAGWMFPGNLQQFVESNGAFNPVDGNRFSMLQRFRQFSPGGALAAPVPTYGPPMPADLNAPPSARSRADEETLRLARSGGGPFMRGQELDLEIARFRDMRDRVEENSDAYRALTDRIQKLTGERNNLEDSQQRGNRLSAQENEVLRTNAGAQREVAEAQRIRREQARNEGRDVGPAELAEVERQTLERLALARRDEVQAAERQVQSENAIAQAYLRSAAAGREAEARARAMEEARRTAAPGTAEFNRLVEEGTRLILARNQAEAENQLARQIPQQEAQLTLMRREAELIGVNNEARERELTLLRERLRLNNMSPGLAESPGGQRYLSNVEEQTRLEQGRRATQEAESYGREVGSSVSKYLYEGIVDGNWRGLRNLEQNLMQIAWRAIITRPLEQALSSAFGGAFGGSGGLVQGMGGTGGGGGLFGWIGGLFGGGNKVGGGGIDKFAGEGTAVAWGAMHNGGVAGFPTMYRSAPVSVFREAPRYHNGGVAGLTPDEVPTILRRHERVRTPEQELSLAGGIRALTEAATSKPRVMPRVTINVTTPNADSFRASQSQVTAAATRAMQRASRDL